MSLAGFDVDLFTTRVRLTTIAACLKKGGPFTLEDQALITWLGAVLERVFGISTATEFCVLATQMRPAILHAIRRACPELGCGSYEELAAWQSKLCKQLNGEVAWSTKDLLDAAAILECTDRLLHSNVGGVHE